jgi:hypothetical protein
MCQAISGRDNVDFTIANVGAALTNLGHKWINSPKKSIKVLIMSIDWQRKWSGILPNLANAVLTMIDE